MAPRPHGARKEYCHLIRYKQLGRDEEICNVMYYNMGWVGGAG